MPAPLAVDKEARREMLRVTLDAHYAGQPIQWQDIDGTWYDEPNPLNAIMAGGNIRPKPLMTQEAE